MKTEVETKWAAIRRDRMYLPAVLTGSRETVADVIENILAERHIAGYSDVMTDQIDVYVGRNLNVRTNQYAFRKVAVYMIEA